MTIKELAELIMEDRGPIIAVILIAATLIQIAPIKINPWNVLLNWVGNCFNKGLIARLDGIDKRLDGVDKRLDEIDQKLIVQEEKFDKHVQESEQTELAAKRVVILDFGSNIIRGVNYHKEKFDFIISECDKYQRYCKDHDIENGVADASIAEIRRAYRDHLHNNDFLVGLVTDTHSES